MKNGAEQLRTRLKKAGLTPLLQPRRPGFPWHFQSVEEFHAHLRKEGKLIEFEEFWIDLKELKRNRPESYSPLIRLHQACQARLATLEKPNP